MNSSLDFLKVRADVNGNKEGVVEQAGVGGRGLPQEGDAVGADALLGQLGRQEAHLAPRPPRRLCRMDSLMFNVATFKLFLTQSLTRGGVGPEK